MAIERFPFNADHGLLQRLAREGQLNYLTVGPPYLGGGSRPVVIAGESTQVGGAGTALGRARFMLEAFLGADQACAVWYQAGQSVFPTAIQQIVTGYALFGPNGGTHRWNFQGGLIIPENCSFNLGYTNPTTSGAMTAGGATWIDVTADFNFNAPNVILFIGDSIAYAQVSGTNGTAGMNGNNGFPMIIRNHLLSKGINVRHINKGVSGMNSPQALVRINDNSFYHCVEETDRVCLIIDAMGMNDASLSPTSQADIDAYQNGLLSLLDYYPRAELIAMSHTGTNDAADGKVSSSATIRGYKRSWVSSLSSPYASRVHFADGTLAYGGSGGASLVPDGSIPTASLGDTATAGIHPNILGHSQIVSNVLGPAIAATTWGQRQPAIRGGW